MAIWQSIDGSIGSSGSAITRGTLSASGPAAMLTSDYVLDGLNQIQQITQQNNARAEAAAREQRNWTEQMWQKSSEFNAAEAAKNREWQEYMSNTAHQREIADLKAAGLNPVLSASGGNGAAVTSGATASSSVGSGSSANLDQSTNSAIVSLLSGFLSAQTQLQAMDMSARSNEAIADKYTAIDALIASLQSSTSRYVSDQSLQAMALSADATKTAAALSAAASRYVADNNLAGTKIAAAMNQEIARMNNDAYLDRQHDEQEFDRYMAKTYPSTYAGLFSSGLSYWNDAGDALGWRSIPEILVDLFSGGSGFSSGRLSGYSAGHGGKY